MGNQALPAMAKGMKAVSAMPAGAVTVAVAEKCGLKAKEVKACISALGDIGVAECRKTGKFTIPGLAMLKMKHKAATPAGTRSMFGKVVKVKAKKASKSVKVFAVKAFKDRAIK